MPNAEIVSIGSELLLGQIVDTNSAWMARRLTDIGVDLYYKTIVGDNPIYTPHFPYQPCRAYRNQQRNCPI